MDINAAFKLYDVRGEYPAVVDERLAFLIGKALILLYHPEKVLLASDTRESSPSLKNFLVDGLTADGTPVFSLGEVPIPQFCFSACKREFNLGVMITASHVREDDNGFKFLGRGGLPFDQEEIINLKNLVTKMAAEPIIVPRQEAMRLDTTGEYVETLLSFSPRRRLNLKLVLDVTKSSVITPALVVFSRLCPAGLNLVKATHGPNPLLAENRRALGEEVRRLQADLGVIWDGDGDRVLFVDNQGRLVSPSFVLGILAAEALRKNRGGKVGVDVRAGLVVRDLVTAAGGELAVFPAWAQNFKFAMAEDPSLVFCGETSGHYLFRDFFSIDDGLYAALRFLFLWEKGELQDTLARLGRKYFELPEKNIPCPSGKAPLILETLADYYRDHDYLISIIDGLSVFGEDFKFNLRQSATEPFLRLNLEAPSESRAREIITRLEEHITL